MVKNTLRLEGLVLFLLSLFFYQNVSGNWLLFILLILLPDISMLGYLKDKKVGAILYNLGHTYVTALLLLALGYLLSITLILELGIILFTHTSMDRFFGFGLKYPTHFKDTHMQKI